MFLRRCFRQSALILLLFVPPAWGTELPQTPGLDPGERFFPYLEINNEEFTGLAVTNQSNKRATVTLTALGSDGALLDLGKNPAVLELDPQEQRARLAREIFDWQGEEPVRGWIYLESTTREIGTMFQFGDLAGTRLDGGVAVSVPAWNVYFTRIHDGSETFHNLDAETRIYLVNPNPFEVEVDLAWFLGQERGTVTLALPARGQYVGRPRELFGRSQISEGYIAATTGSLNGSPILGFSRIDLLGSSIGLQAQPWRFNMTNTRSYYSAQLVSLADFVTELNLVNLFSLKGTAILTAVDEAGEVIGGPKQLELNRFDATRIDLADFFDLPEGATGSLKIEPPRDVVGDLLFGDPGGGYATGLPLQWNGFRQAAFGHLAVTPDFFTGLALYAFEGAADIDLRVGDPLGSIVAQDFLDLGAGTRVSKRIRELTTLNTQAGGRVEVESSSGLAAQMIFGSTDLNRFSAVPGEESRKFPPLDLEAPSILYLDGGHHASPFIRIEQYRVPDDGDLEALELVWRSDAVVELLQERFNPISFAVGDLLDEGSSQLIAVGNTKIAFFRPGSDGSPDIVSTLDQSGVKSMKVGDVDNDGQPELIIASRSEQTAIRILAWVGSGFEKDHQIVAPAFVKTVDVGDADNDGLNELVVAASDAGMLVYELEGGVWKSAFVERVDDHYADFFDDPEVEGEPLRSEIDIARVSDLDPCGSECSNGPGNEIYVGGNWGGTAIYRFDDGAMQYRVVKTSEVGSASSHSAATGDLDGDDDVELATLSTSQHLSVYEQQSTGLGRKAQNRFPGLDFEPILSFANNLNAMDLDHDGKAELIMPGRQDSGFRIVTYTNSGELKLILQNQRSSAGIIRTAP